MIQIVNNSSLTLPSPMAKTPQHNNSQVNSTLEARHQSLDNSALSIEQPISVEVVNPTNEITWNREAQATWAKQQQKMEQSVITINDAIDALYHDAPSFKDKRFDFTHNGNEIEIVDHNLSDSEYQFLKSRFNGDKQLVTATEFANDYVAEFTPGANKEDIQGQTRFVDMYNDIENRYMDNPFYVKGSSTNLGRYAEYSLATKSLKNRTSFINTKV